MVVVAEAKEIRAKNTWAKRWAAILKKLLHVATVIFRLL